MPPAFTGPNRRLRPRRPAAPPPPTNLASCTVFHTLDPLAARLPPPAHEAAPRDGACPYTGSGQALAGSASADRSIVSFISAIDTAGKFFTKSRNRVKKSPNDPTVIAASTHVGW